MQISGTRATYYVGDLEGQLRDTIVARMSEIFASSDLSFLDMTAKQGLLGDKIIKQIKPGFTALGLELDQFVVQNISLPDELQKILDQRIGMNMVGDLGRFTQFEAAESLDIAAANPGGAAGMGMGLGAGAAVAQTLSASLRSTFVAPVSPAVPEPSSAPDSGASAAGTKFCIECGKSIPQRAKFCAECGKPQ
jgi:membrane protease subunit (stomatin/prohibitin family)